MYAKSKHAICGTSLQNTAWAHKISSWAFASNTENVIEHARAKRARKGCDWILANDVAPGTGTFGGDHNEIFLISGVDATSDETWPRQGKNGVARALAERIIQHFA